MSHRPIWCPPLTREFLQAVFDLFAILLIVLNALDRPYQSNIDVVVAVQRDGVKLFVVSGLCWPTTLAEHCSTGPIWSELPAPLYHGNNSNISCSALRLGVLVLAVNNNVREFNNLSTAFYSSFLDGCYFFGAAPVSLNIIPQRWFLNLPQAPLGTCSNCKFAVTLPDRWHGKI